MRICIPCIYPGGSDGVASTSFEEADVFDFYDVKENGEFEQVAQSRVCMCWGADQAEAIARRGIDAIIVATISPNSLLKFKSFRVKVLRSNNPSVAALTDSFASGKLEEIGIGEFARLGKTNEKE